MTCILSIPNLDLETRKLKICINILYFAHERKCWEETTLGGGELVSKNSNAFASAGFVFLRMFYMSPKSLVSSVRRADTLDRYVVDILLCSVAAKSDTAQAALAICFVTDRL